MKTGNSQRILFSILRYKQCYNCPIDLQLTLFYINNKKFIKTILSLFTYSVCDEKVEILKNKTDENQELKNS